MVASFEAFASEFGEAQGLYSSVRDVTDRYDWNG